MVVKDPNFKAEKIIVGCHVVCNGEILFLQRHKDKPQGNTYGLPAGKVNKNESTEQAILRELKEETGIVADINDLVFQRVFNVVYSNYSFDFYVYNLYLNTKPNICINNTEHMGYIWCKPKEALELDLIEDEDYILKELFIS